MQRRYIGNLHTPLDSQPVIVTRRKQIKISKLKIRYSHRYFIASASYDVLKKFVYFKTQLLKVTTKQSTLAAVSCYCQNMFAFDTQSLLWNVLYKWVLQVLNKCTVEELGETRTAIRVSVSKYCVIFFLWRCSQTEG
jgi:hypothetical protein